MDEQSTYGIMKECSEKQLRDIIDFLCEKGYLSVLGGQYPVLKLTQHSNPVLCGEETLTMKQSKTVTVERKLSKKQVMANIDTSLFTRLKQLRLVLANKQNVPAYIVFNDATLVDMCAKLPRTMSEFLEVSGVGNAKAQQYGEIFLDTIKHYLDSKQKKDS